LIDASAAFSPAESSEHERPDPADRLAVRSPQQAWTYSPPPARQARKQVDRESFAGGEALPLRKRVWDFVVVDTREPPSLKIYKSPRSFAGE
jgi:hypothetical protein